MIKLGNVITDYQFHKRHSDALYIMPNMKEKGSKSNATKELDTVKSRESVQADNLA